MSLNDPAPPAVAQCEHLLTSLDDALRGVEELVPLDEERFLETHAVYEGRSDQQRQIIDWFGEHIAPDEADTDRLRVLSVGCGSGMADVPIATRLATDTDELVYVGVDPNHTECAAFEKLFADADLDGAQLAVSASTFEDFESPHAFDLVHFIHCLYYMPDPAAALRRARDLLAPQGKLVVMHAPCERLNDLAVRFYDKGYGRATPFAEDLIELLERWGWDYECQRVDAHLDVTPCVAGDVETGLALRDFIVQFDSRRLPAGVQAIIDRYLRAIAVQRGDRFLIPHPVDILVTGA